MKFVVVAVPCSLPPLCLQLPPLVSCVGGVSLSCLEGDAFSVFRIKRFHGIMCILVGVRQLELKNLVVELLQVHH